MHRVGQIRFKVCFHFTREVRSTSHFLLAHLISSFPPILLFRATSRQEFSSLRTLRTHYLVHNEREQLRYLEADKRTGE